PADDLDGVNPRNGDRERGALRVARFGAIDQEAGGVKGVQYDGPSLPTTIGGHRDEVRPTRRVRLSRHEELDDNRRGIVQQVPRDYAPDAIGRAGGLGVVAVQ